MTRRTNCELRNVAIVAHVDHGKTTLVDALLRQAGAFGDHGAPIDRVLDSLDLEREKGITILAKQASFRFGTRRLNLVDTPGHADFGGEVERALAMVDGAMLLVDASDGPGPQTRFVLRKAFAARLPVVPIVNKVDRPDARIAEVVDATMELFLELEAPEDQYDIPFLFGSARDGWLTATEPAGPVPSPPAGGDLSALVETLFAHLPAPSYTEGAALQALVTNLDSSPYLGRLAICRVVEGTIEDNQPVAWCRRDGTVTRVRVSALLAPSGLDRVPVKWAGPGELVAVGGLAEVTVGETLADVDAPVALPLLFVDEPNLSMTVAVNSSPLAGRDGTKLTARLLRSRLEAEVVGNVAIRLVRSDRSDTFEVHGRGELALAVLVETMRREGFELTVGKPQVLTRTVEGVRCEPIERFSLEFPEEQLGAVTQLVARRKARVDRVAHHGTGWVHLEGLVPSRGLIGIRGELLTQTHGTAQLHHSFERYEPWRGEIRSRTSGSLVADRPGTATAFAITNLSERGSMFVVPGEEVYEGMIVGESSRGDDIDVNVTKGRKLTNMRTSTADEFVKLPPIRRLTLEQALEHADESECVEVTPATVRLRKAVLARHDRARARGRERRAAPG
ncbi:MAG TPA: translational GTPase TypA [Acidimicrobiales bacterium]|nr:translational GTPase TypA [Acidimicrobiales bacterium]